MKTKGHRINQRFSFASLPRGITPPGEVGTVKYVIDSAGLRDAPVRRNAQTIVNKRLNVGHWCTGNEKSAGVRRFDIALYIFKLPQTCGKVKRFLGDVFWVMGQFPQPDPLTKRLVSALSVEVDTEANRKEWSLSHVE